MIHEDRAFTLLTHRAPSVDELLEELEELAEAMEGVDDPDGFRLTVITHNDKLMLTFRRFENNV